MTESILQPGATLGHYRIVSLLGAGGMGQVYLAADDRLRRNVALKILPDTIVHDESRLRRFTLEAQTASALNHPSIVTIYEIGSAPYSSGERHYIAMEVIEGKTLRESPVNRSNLKKLLPPFIDAQLPDARTCNARQRPHRICNRSRHRSRSGLARSGTLLRAGTPTTSWRRSTKSST